VKAFGTPAGNAEEELAAFLRLAGHLMKRPLSSRAVDVDADDDVLPAITGEQALQDVEDPLSRLAKIDPRLRTVVEMKVFEGMSNAETARQLGCSRGTVATCWRLGAALASDRDQRSRQEAQRGRAARSSAGAPGLAPSSSIT